MRTLLLVLLVTTAVAARTQITLEHTYPDAGFYQGGGNESGQLFLLDLEFSGTKYVKVDRVAKMVTLFNLDHTFYKDFSFASAPSNTATPVIMYLSEHLFDLDDGIEYLYTLYDGFGPVITRVYDEDGTVLLNADSGAVWVQNSIPPQQYPIWNTPQGTKLMISYQPEASARVYSLPGTLADDVATGTESMVATTPPAALLFPDPTEDHLTIRYTGLFNEPVEEVRLMDAGGRMVQVQALGAANGSIDLPTVALAAGVYSVALRTHRGIFPVGQFVKTR